MKKSIAEKNHSNTFVTVNIYNYYKINYCEELYHNWSEISEIFVKCLIIQ